MKEELLFRIKETIWMGCIVYEELSGPSLIEIFRRHLIQRNNKVK